MTTKDIIKIEVDTETLEIISKMIEAVPPGDNIKTCTLTIHHAITLLDRMCIVMGQMLLYSPNDLLPVQYYSYKRLAQEICRKLE